MSRKQKALEERYRKPPQYRLSVPHKKLEERSQYLRNEELKRAAKEAEEHYIEMNRDCTIADVHSEVDNYIGGVWSMYVIYTSKGHFPDEPKWKAPAKEIAKYVVAEAENSYTGTVSTHGFFTSYTKEFIAYCKVKATEEFARRQTPLYQLL